MALYSIGAINKTTLREYDEACLSAVPEQIPAEQIKQLRENSHVSQPVFARYLNTSASTVKKWESGKFWPEDGAMPESTEPSRTAKVD